MKSKIIDKTAVVRNYASNVEIDFGLKGHFITNIFSLFI